MVKVQQTEIGDMSERMAMAKSFEAMEGLLGVWEEALKGERKGV